MPPPPPPPPPVGSPGWLPGLPPTPVAPLRPRSRPLPRGFTAGAIAVTLSLVAGLVGLVVAERDSLYPDEWDPAVADFAAFVERERDLDFDHPVHVDLLPEDEFVALVTSEEFQGPPQPAGEDDGDLYAGYLRAVGLLEGPIDLGQANSELDGSGILGFYSFDTRRITMRGDTLTPSMEVTLVHEMVHALQDQRFDLGEIEAGIRNATQYSAYLALVEGDAERVASAYVDRLSDADFEALADEELANEEDYEAGVADVPHVLQVFSAAPYAFGQALVELAFERGGNDAVDALYDDVPETEEQIFDPWRLVDRDDPAMVDPPELAATENEIERGTFGSVYWMVMLSERIDLVDALDAVDGWGGDEYVAFERDGRACARINYVGDTPTDTDQMASALEAWGRARPESEVAVARADDMLVFETCDPGADVEPIGRDAGFDAVTIAINRTYIAVSELDSGAEEDWARCFADGVVHQYTLDQIDVLYAGDGADEDYDALDRLFLTCSAGN